MALTTVKIETGAAEPVAGAPGSPASAQGTASSAKAGGSKAPVRRNILLGAACLALMGLLWLGADWLLNGRFSISTDNAYLRSDITRVTPKIQGYVTKIHVAENQPVKTGDLLITIEASDFQARVAQARAELAQAQADAGQAEARIAAQRDSLAEARAAREAADASADWSSSDARRLAELAEKGWYPKAKVEQANAAERAAKARLDQAQASVTSQRSQLTSTEAAARSAGAKIEAARAKLAAAELDLGRTEVRAPVDGVIANKVIAEGQLLSPNQPALAIVTPDVWVVANFKETQIAEMKVGQCARIHVDAFPNLRVRGKVQSIAPSTGATFSLVPQDTATGNFTKIVQRVPVKIVLDKDALGAGLLRSGLQVTATVSTKPDCGE